MSTQLYEALCKAFDDDDDKRVSEDDLATVCEARNSGD